MCWFWEEGHQRCALETILAIQPFVEELHELREAHYLREEWDGNEGSQQIRFRLWKDSGYVHECDDEVKGSQ